MTRLVTALALALSLASISAAASAAPAKAQAARHEKGDHDDKKFPMKADDYRQYVAQHVARGRELLERHISAKKMPEGRAQALRAKFDAGVLLLNARVEQVCADGTVTADEARQVRAFVKAMVQQHMKGGHGKKGDKK